MNDTSTHHNPDGEEEEQLLHLSTTATFADLAAAIEHSFEEKPDRHGRTDRLNNVFWSELHNWRTDLADRVFNLLNDQAYYAESQQTQVLQFFEDEGADRDEVETFLPIVFDGGEQADSVTP